MNLNHFQDLLAIQYRDAVPQLLIGLDNVWLMKPQEIRSSEESKLIAVRSPLGWSIYGTLSTNKAAALFSADHLARGSSIPLEQNEVQEGSSPSEYRKFIVESVPSASNCETGIETAQ